jgi:hypothetical protein
MTDDHEEDAWKINEAFLRQQLKQGMKIILSHDPAKATGFFKQRNRGRKKDFANIRFPTEKTGTEKT